MPEWQTEQLQKLSVERPSGSESPPGHDYTHCAIRMQSALGPTLLVTQVLHKTLD